MKVLKEIPCNSWEDFKVKSNNLQLKKDYVFRGQNDSDWVLETSLQRFFRKIGTGNIALSGPDPIEEILTKYIRYINIIEKNNTYQNKDDYWSVGQHYGLPTPYLDWTNTIYKAAFFAFCDEVIFNNGHDRIAVYALRIKNVDELAGNADLKTHLISNGGIKAFEREGFSIINHNSKVINDRLESQDGLFTMVNGLSNIQHNLVDFFDKKIYNVYRLAKPILIKFTIPRMEYKNALLDMHLTTQTNFFKIYPDKEGCSKQVRFETILGL